MLSTLINGELAIKEQLLECNDLKQTVPEEITNFSSNNIKPLGFDTNIVMEILQNRIYTNKNIVFQELPCNGRDAIIRRINSGYKDFLPEIKIIFNYKDDKLTISDNGCGMSEKIIDEVYRFYGRSDKRNTMDEIGMFGIGSKSVFAIADEFIVETDAIDDRLHCKYLVTKRGIIQLSKSPSIGNFGTSITFTKPKDFYLYNIEDFLNNKFMLWNIPINIYMVNQEEDLNLLKNVSKKSCEIEDIFKVNMPDGLIKFETEDYIFISGPNIKEQSIYICQIPYNAYNFSQDIKNMTNKKFVIYIKNPNIITISATRENIENDEKMKNLDKNIKSKLEEEIKKQMNIIFSDFDIKNIKNIEDIEFLFNIENIMKINYPKICYSLCLSAYVISKGNRKNYLSFFNILKYKSNVTWTKRKINNTFTIRDDEKVVLIDNENSIFMDIFPEFVPVKIVREKNKFKALNLYNNKEVLFNYNCFTENKFTTEYFKTKKDDYIYQISDKKLKYLKNLNSNINVITKKEYQELEIKSLVVSDIDGVKYYFNDIIKYTTIIHSYSSHVKHDIVKKMFSKQEDLFITETLDSKIIEYLKNKGITVVNLSEFLKLKNIKLKLKLKNIPNDIIFDLLRILANEKELTSKQEDSVITYEKIKRKKCEEQI